MNENINARRRNEKGSRRYLTKIETLCCLPLERFLNPTTTFVVLVQLTDGSVVNKIKNKRGFYIFLGIKKLENLIKVEMWGKYMGEKKKGLVVVWRQTSSKKATTSSLSGKCMFYYLLLPL